MLTLLLPYLVTLLRIEGLPGQDPSKNYERPTSSVDPSYFELLERNSHIVYPALAIITLALIAYGIIQAWRSQDMDVATKVEYKRVILAELRRHLHGLGGEELARTVGLERLKVVRLLEQMQQEGMVESHTNSKRITVWRVRGANAPSTSRYG